MSVGPPRSDVDSESEEHGHALIGLHALAGSLDPADVGTIPGFRTLSPATALRTIADAPIEEVPVSARLDILHALAQADFPHFDSSREAYERLAGSVAAAREIDPQRLFDDLKESAGEATPFATTASGRALPHHETAFLGEQVCTIRTVTVDGIGATWIFSEFETDAPFEHVAGWVDPRSWPDRGPLLFKGMSPVGSPAPVPIQALSDDHWHAVFHEDVQLVSRVNTLLHCDYWRDGDRAAGMTYELDLSLDGELDVDRGFLSVNDLGPARRVKALKIVGFTHDPWDRVARLVCPFWTDWVRAAVEGGSTTSPTTPSHHPPGDGAPVGDTLEAWFDFLGDSARVYLDLFGDVVSRASSTGYSTSAWLEDGRRYWSQLARDWARAWQFGLDLVEDVSQEGLDASFMPPDRDRAEGRGLASAMTAAPAPSAESTIVPLDTFDEANPPLCSDLVSIEAGGFVISAPTITVTAEDLGQAAVGARIATTDTSAPPGLYVGQLEVGGGRRIPVQLYLSRAARV